MQTEGRFPFKVDEVLSLCSRGQTFTEGARPSGKDRLSEDSGQRRVCGKCELFLNFTHWTVRSD